MRARWLDPRIMLGAALSAAILGSLHAEAGFGFLSAGLIGLAWLGVVVFGLGSLAWGIARHRPVGRVVGVYAIASVILGLVLGGWVVGRREQETIARGDRIAAALESFSADAGGYPGSLSELVPRYLEAVPSTAMSRFREMVFQYQPDGRDGYWLGFFAPGWTWCYRDADSPWSCSD